MNGLDFARTATRWAQRTAGATALGALVAAALIVAPVALPQAALATSSDVSLQTLTVTPASTAGSPKAPGQTFVYTLGFSCDSTVGGTCAGAVVDDVLPAFVDVFGDAAQLVATGSPSGTVGIWASGPAFTGAAPNVHVTGTLNATSVPGEVYSLSFSAIAPPGRFPTTVTQLDDTVTATGGKTSPTVQSFVRGTAPSWTIDKSGPAQLLLGANGTYTVKACPATAASALPASFSFSDLLPPGASFVSASNGGVGPAHDPADGTSDTVTWAFDTSNRPWPMSGNCVAVTTVARYVEDPALNNLTGVVKTNTATGTFDATSLGSDSVGTQLRGPITRINGTKSVGIGGYYAHPGDPVRYDLGLTNNSETGAMPLDSAVIVDRLAGAADFDLDTISTGTWASGVTAVVEVSADGTTWTAVAGSPFNGTTADVPVVDGFRFVRWSFTGPIPVGFSTSGIRLTGTMGTPASQPTTETNCLDATALRGASSFSDGNNCVNMLLEDPQADPSVAKSITSVIAADGTTSHTATTVTPGDTITYALTVGNGGDATGPLTDPVVTDCAAMSAYFRDPVVTPGSGWALDGAYTDSSCATAGGTALRFVYAGTALNPGQSSTVATYTVLTTKFGDAEGVTPANTYPNTAVLTKATGSFAHGTMSASATATVPAFIYLASQKWVLGARDIDAGPGPDSSRNAGETDPGGGMTWYITVRNKGNVPAKDPVYVDVFPHIGDTGVKRSDQTRDSEWAAYLVQPIVAPPGWTVQYSTSSNPCRPEVGPNPTSSTPWPAGCQAPNWTTNTDQFALPGYRSIRLALSGSIAIGAPEIEFSWDMRAPVYDPTYDLVGGAPGVVTTDPYERLAACGVDPNALTQDPSTVAPCPRAINSFAWAAEADATAIDPALNPGRLSTEPPRVGIQVGALPTSGNIVGDRVWNDVDFDGVQDAGETGVGGVRVELLKFDGASFLTYGYTFTDPGGNYLFADQDVPSSGGLPDGDYRVRFSLPPQWYVSPQDAAAATDATDSDVPPVASGTNAGVAYYDTDTFTLGPDQTDLTRDVGIWVAGPSIDVVKTTRDTAWAVNQAGDGVTVFQGRGITWTYTMTNTGNTRLENVVLRDDNGTAGSTGDDFSVTNCVVTNPGTTAEPSLPTTSTAPFALNRGGVLTCTATGIAGSGTYSNLATATGTPMLDDGGPIVRGAPPATVSDTDPSGYNVAKYDLALAKTAGTPNYLTGRLVYTITVKNQGTVGSGLFEVTDTLPAGTSFVSAAPAETSASAGVIVWTGLANLAAGASTTLTVTVHIDDYLQTPFRNVAEISDDSSESVTTLGVSTPTVDVDSTPDALPGNDMPGGKTYGPAGTPTAGGADNASIADAGTGTDGEDDADIADVSTAPTYDLALAKTANATTLAVDGSGHIVYTITVQNQGNVASGTYQVTDTVPAGLAVTTPVAGGGTVTPGATVTIDWTGASLASGASATYTYTATVTDLTKRPFRNIAEISADSAMSLYGVHDIDSTPDANTGNDMPGGKTYGPAGHATGGGADNISIADAGTGTDGEDDADIADVDLPLTNSYDLALIKTADATTITHDGTVTYTITVQNQGVLDARQFVITDHVPAGLAVADAGSATVHGDGTIAWTVSDLAAGASTTRTFSATIADITLRPFRNVAEISSDSANTYSSSTETVHDVDSTPDLDVANDGAYGVVMAAGAIDNLVTTDAGSGADDPASGGEDDADIADVDVPVTYDLALVKTGSATIGADGTAQFAITVQNQGNVPSGAFTVADVVPAGMTVVAASNGGSFPVPSAAVTWSNLPSLAPGASVTLTATMRVVDYTLRPFRNSAEIAADSAATYTATGGPAITDIDSVPGDLATSADDNTDIGQAGTGTDAGFDDEDIATVTMVPVYDLALVKVADAATTTYDGSVTFTVTVQNQGNVPSGAFTVADTLPAGTSFVSATNAGAVAAASKAVVWNLASIAPGASAAVQVTVAVSDITQRPFVNSAEVTADSAATYSLPGGPTLADVDSVPGDVMSSTVDNTAIEQAGVGADAGFDDEDTARFDVPIVYDLDLVKRLPPGQRLKLGSVIHYEITVTNQGNVPSGLYTVEDALPVGLTFVSGSDGATTQANVVRWADLPSLAPGRDKTVTVEVRLDDITQPSYVNVASITRDGSASLSTPIESVSDRDSQPGTPMGQPSPDEDDWSVASLSMPQLVIENAPLEVPVPTPLPVTGADVITILATAALALVAGLLLVTGVGRRRRARS